MATLKKKEKENKNKKKLDMEMKILDKIQTIFNKLVKDLGEKMDKIKDKVINQTVENKTVENKTEIIKIFKDIKEMINKDEYKIVMTDEEIEIGVNVLNVDKYLISYRQFIENENEFTKRDMERIYSDVHIVGDKFLMERSLLYLKFYYDFVQKTNNTKNKLYSDIERRIKKINQELGTSDMMKDYVSSRITNLMVNKVKKVDIKPIADEIKKMSKEIRDLIPRTKSEHVGISMHKIRGGKQNGILWKNMFNKYNRNDLNLISKHYGLKNIEKIRNKKTMINNLNAIILYRSGKFNKRKELNLFSKLFGINPKLYKRKKDLIHKLNQTIF
jgi:hypothetical protein